MTRDPIVAEIRKFRDRYARKHGYNIRAMADDLKQFQAALASRPLVAHSKLARKAAR